MRIVLAAVGALLIAGTAAAQPKTDSKAPPAVVVEPLPSGVTPRPVAITRLGSRVRDDQQVGTMWYGVVCIQPMPVTWKEVARQFVDLEAIFGEELRDAGFKPDKDPGSLFAEEEHAATDLQVGAMLTGVRASYCGDLVHVSGKMGLDVEWQVYSTLRHEVVAKIETHEGAQRSKGLGGSKETKRSLAQMAFAANVRGLLANPEFRQLVSSPDPSVSAPQMAKAGQGPINLVGAIKGPVKVADASGAVVAVFAGSAFGSGVLVSSDGYLLTNHHVVGTAETVRIRWSDGFETTGQVIRSDKRRDVALVKTDAHGRSALRVQRVTPPVGATVYAVGTPLDPKLQNSVTRGIVSGNRIVDGFNFIQSDTPVTHGNSGGPLIDETGAVVGLTDWGMPAEEGSTLNFFIPIGDALDFLALKPVP